MARDERLRMRNGLVIPGVLITVYGVLAILYAEAVRSRSDFCADSNLILIAGICYTVWKLILPLVLIGLALTVTGVAGFRGKPDDLEGHLQHGTPAHTILALLISFVGVGSVLWIVQMIRQSQSGRVFEIQILNALYEHTFLLEIVVVVALVLLIPYLVLYISFERRRKAFMEAAESALDDESLPHEEGFDYQDTTAAEDEQAGAMVPDDHWPAGREGEPDDASVPIARTSTVVGCMAKDGVRSCTQPIVEGTRYCAEHACQGKRRDGESCTNVAVKDGFCQVHAASS